MLEISCHGSIIIKYRLRQSDIIVQGGSVNILFGRHETHLNASNCRIGNCCMFFCRLSIIVNFQIEFFFSLKIIFQKYHQIMKQFALRSSPTISNETTNVTTSRQRVNISSYKKRGVNILLPIPHNTRAESQIEILLSLSVVPHERSK